MGQELYQQLQEAHFETHKYNFIVTSLISAIHLSDAAVPRPQPEIVRVEADNYARFPSQKHSSQ
jgi:hypothetical protein